MPGVTRRPDLSTGHSCWPPKASIEASPNVFANGLAVERNGDALEIHCCLAGDTLIFLVEERLTPIQELIGRKKFDVWAYDREKNTFTKAEGHSCKLYHEDFPTMKIQLDDIYSVVCTSDHEILKYDGVLTRTCDLRNGDRLWSMTASIGYRVIKDIFYYGMQDVYCFTVDKYHNFALSGGIFVANCNLVCHGSNWIGTSTVFVNGKAIQKEGSPQNDGDFGAQHSDNVIVEG